MVEFKQNQWIFVGEWWFLMTWQCSKTWWLMYLLIKYISYTHLWSHVRDINDMINIYSFFFFVFLFFLLPFRLAPGLFFLPVSLLLLPPLSNLRCPLSFHLSCSTITSMVRWGNTSTLSCGALMKVPIVAVKHVSEIQSYEQWCKGVVSSRREMKCGNSALQIQIVLRCLKALSLLQFLKTCLMASFKPDRLCLLISQS